ncbi:hypothetical protein ACS0PU_012827 [Formica fusca]
MEVEKFNFHSSTNPFLASSRFQQFSSQTFFTVTFFILFALTCQHVLSLADEISSVIYYEKRTLFCLISERLRFYLGKHVCVIGAVEAILLLHRWRYKIYICREAARKIKSKFDANICSQIC